MFLFFTCYITNMIIRTHIIDHVLSSVSTVVNKISQGFKYCDNIETAFLYVKATQNQYHPSQLLLDCSRDTCTKQNPGRIWNTISILRGIEIERYEKLFKKKNRIYCNLCTTFTIHFFPFLFSFFNLYETEFRLICFHDK